MTTTLSTAMHDEVQKKIDKLLEPPPVKAPKPLPKPDDPIRKKRGGRRCVYVQCLLSVTRPFNDTPSFAQSEENEGALLSVQH